jgi:putative holliday junction resolvase
MRSLGLDIGERRIGFAFANVLSVGTSVVLPGGFLQADNEMQAVEKITGLITEEGVSEVVVGLPLQNGQETGQAKKIKRLAEKVREKFPNLPFFYWDESLTSVAANEALTGAELKHTRGKKKGRVDAVAAALILQSFVDSRRLYPGA